jgi:hypothetical protein
LSNAPTKKLKTVGELDQILNKASATSRFNPEDLTLLTVRLHDYKARKLAKLEKEIEKAELFFYDYYTRRDTPLKVLLAKHELSEAQHWRMLKKFRLPPIKRRLRLQTYAQA